MKGTKTMELTIKEGHNYLHDDKKSESKEKVHEGVKYLEVNPRDSHAKESKSPRKSATKSAKKS